MGLDVTVPRSGPLPLAPLMERLAGAGVPCTVAMVDGALVAPAGPFPDAWSEARIRTPAGMVTLARRPGGIAVVVFGNAGEPLLAAQQAIAAALAATA